MPFAPNKRYPGFPWIQILVLVFMVGKAAAAPAPESGLETFGMEWGGYLRTRGSAAWFTGDSPPVYAGDDTWYDGAAEMRLNNTIFRSGIGYFQTQYEMVYAAGDAVRAQNTLQEAFPGLSGDLYPLLGIFAAPSDSRRFFDLTHVIDTTRDSIWYHRLDRLNLTLQPQWGTIRIGRQALTWGNGMLFQPMDLFNPFSPTDFERDYKVGDDMVFVQARAGAAGDVQLLAVPRRNPDNGEVEWKESSLAGKWHDTAGGLEYDLMAAAHYDDVVTGVGVTGYAGGAAWRMDTTLTLQASRDYNGGYVSLVANMDYSWIWWDKNFYGFIEFYYNGLGKTDPGEAISDPEILKRIERGDLFVLERFYLDGDIRCELHPLFNVHLTWIQNLTDGSGILQPRGVWDITQNLQLIAGGNIAYGGAGTEYGGFRIPGTVFDRNTPDSAWIWLTYYF